MPLQTFLHDPSIDRRPFWYLLIRIGISILIGISLFVVGGKWGFAIALGLFVVGVGVKRAHTPVLTHDELGAYQLRR